MTPLLTGSAHFQIYATSSGLPRTLEPKVAIAMMTTIIAVVIEPNTPTPISRRT